MDDVRKVSGCRHFLLAAAFAVTAPGGAFALTAMPDLGQQLREAAPTADNIILVGSKVNTTSRTRLKANNSGRGTVSCGGSATGAAGGGVGAGGCVSIIGGIAIGGAADASTANGNGKATGLGKSRVNVNTRSTGRANTNNRGRGGGGGGG